MMIRPAINRDDVLEDIRNNWDGAVIRSTKINWDDPYHTFKHTSIFRDGSSKEYLVGNDYSPLVYLLWDEGFWNWSLGRVGLSERPTPRMRMYRDNNPYRTYYDEIVEECTHIDYIEFPKLRNEVSKHEYRSPERHNAYQNHMRELHCLESSLIWNYHPKYNIKGRDRTMLCEYTDPEHTLKYYHVL